MLDHRRFLYIAFVIAAIPLVVLFQNCGNLRDKSILRYMTATPSNSSGTSKVKYDLGALSIIYYPVDRTGRVVDPNVNPSTMEALEQLTRESSANVDLNVIRRGDTHGLIENWAKRQIAATLNAFSDFTRYRGNPSALPSVRITNLATIEYDEPIPYVNGILPSGPLSDMNSMLNRQNICDWVDNKNVREVWIYKVTAKADYAHPEFYISSPRFSHWQQMNWLAEAAPVCKYTYNIVIHDLDRWDLPLHPWYHAFEARMDLVDRELFRLWQGPCDSRYTCHPGGSDSGKIARCGNAHNAPNARDEYDLLNPTPILSDCENWNPDGPNGFGSLIPVDCQKWGCGGRGTIESNETRNFYIWNLQHLPGAGNTITYKGKKLRDWWDVYGDFDSIMLRGENLFLH